MEDLDTSSGLETDLAASSDSHSFLRSSRVRTASSIDRREIGNGAIVCGRPDRSGGSLASSYESAKDVWKTCQARKDF